MIKKYSLITVMLIGALAVGFFMGNQVQANPFAPGSPDDPLVAKSYLEEQLQLKVSELEGEIARLTDKANELQGLIDELTK